MKKVFLSLILIILSISNLYSLQSHNGVLIDEKRIFGFTIEPSLGYLYGETREIVYVNGLSDTYLSELIWDLQNILYIGSSASLNYRNRLYLNLGIWTALNPGNGYMMDFDWISGDIQSDGYGRSDWTHWSWSSVEVLESLLFDVNLSFDFVRIKELNISALAGYKNIYWNWSDKILDSYYDGVADVIPIGIDGIDYQLGLDIIYLGIGSGYYSKGFIVHGNFIYSPIVFGGDHDHHILTNTHYYDEISLGQYIAFSLKSGYQFTNFFSLTAQLSAEYLFEKRGNTYIYNDSGLQVGQFPGGAGIQYQTISFSINAAFSF